MQQAHIFYSGMVQGVGFRFTAEHIATAFHLTGWVRNLSDGRVEMVVQGEEAAIQQFRERLAARFDGSIASQEFGWEPAGEAYSEFRIARSA